MVLAGGYVDKCEEELRQALFSAKHRRSSASGGGIGNQASHPHPPGSVVAEADLARCRALLQRYAEQVGSRDGAMQASDKLRHYQNELSALQSSRPDQPLLVPTPFPPKQMMEQDMAPTDQRILEAQRMAQESTDISVGILNDLRRQREEIARAQQTLLVTDANVSESNRLMRQMFARINVNRFLSYALIALLLFSIVVVLYYKIIR